MKLFDLYATLGLDAKAFNSGISSARSEFNAFSSSVGSGIKGLNLSIGGILNSTASAMVSLERTVQRGVVVAGTAFSAMLGGLATTGVKYNSVMENYQMDFTTLLQDADKAADKVEELRKLDLTSPMDMTALANATKLMLSFGVAEEEVSDKLLELSDISMGNAERLSALSLAFAQIRSVGKLTMIDMRQMANQGFNPLKVVAEQTGVAIGDLQDFMSYGKPSEDMTASIKAAKEEVRQLGDNASVGAKMLVQMSEEGQISADIVSKAITIATSAGGQFYKATENASKTLTGQLSILQGGVKKLIGSGFEPLSENLTEIILPNLNEFVDDLDSAFNRRGGGAEGLTAMLGVVRDELVELREETGTFTEDARKGIIRASVLFNNTTKTINGSLPTMLDAGETLFEQLRIGFKNAIPNIAETAELLAAPVASGIIDAKADFTLAGLEILGGIAEGINADFSEGGERKIETALNDGLGNIASWFSSDDNTDNMADAAVALLTAFGNAITDNAPEILGGVADTLARIVTAGQGEEAQQDAGGIARGIVESTASFLGFGAKAIGNKLGLVTDAEVRAAYDEFGEDLTSTRDKVAEYRRNKLAAAGEKYVGEFGPMPYANYATFAEIERTAETYRMNAIASGAEDMVDAEYTRLETMIALAKEMGDVDLFEKYTAQFSALSMLVSDANFKDANEAIKAAEAIANGETTLDLVVEDWGSFGAAVEAVNESIAETISLLQTLSGDDAQSQFQGKGTKRIMVNGFSDLLNYVPGFDNGLNYVPYDEYIARLHEGEAVLTREEARKWRRNEQNVDMMVLQQSEQQRPIVISIDGTELATVLYGEMNKRIENGTRQQVYGRGG